MCVERTFVSQCIAMMNVNLETKCGFDLGDDMAFLPDLGFADDILFFARTAVEAMALLDDLVHKLQNIRLQLNRRKTAVLISVVQPPFLIPTTEVKNEFCSNKDTQMARLHDQRCRIKEHAFGSST